MEEKKLHIFKLTKLYNMAHIIIPCSCIMKIKLLKKRNQDKNFWNKQIFRMDMFPRAEFLPGLWVVPSLVIIVLDF